MCDINSSDLIDELLTYGFSSLSYEEKCSVKGKRPTPCLMLSQKDGNVFRNFNMHWYSKYVWLSGSTKRNKLYCFLCVLFGGETEWSKDGITTIKNFERKACKHQSSQKHLKNRECFHMLGRTRIEHALSESYRLATVHHNEKVATNRKILGRLIQAICFLGKQELAFRGHREGPDSLNKGNYLELLDLLAEEEPDLKMHLESSSFFKGLSSDFQNEMIECITYVLQEIIKREIDQAQFISVQADDTTDVSCKSQLSIILRYAIEDRIEERFIGFFDVSKDKTAESLSTVILDNLKLWNVGSKLVCQTYDGASVFGGEHKGVQAIVKQSFPHAIFIHCYAHRMNLVLLNGAKYIKQVKLFISDVTMFNTFFSRSTKRSDLLRQQGFKLPQHSDTRWNYNSRAASTIKSHFHELEKAVRHVIENDGWDPVSVSCARGLLNRLNDATFVFLLCLFDKVFVHTDHLFSVLQAKVLSDIKLCCNEVRSVLRNFKEMRNEKTVVGCCQQAKVLKNSLTFTEDKSTTLRILTFHILDSFIGQIEQRFADFEEITFVELLNEDKFKDYHVNFPQSRLNKLKAVYPFFMEEQLQNELCIIYSDQEKHLPPLKLLKYIYQNGLHDIYEQVTKLLYLVLSLPATTASSERGMSTLKRIKTYLRNSMTNERLSCLSFMSIEKALLSEQKKDSKFKERVIDVYAEKKNRRIELMYKNI